MPPWLDLDREKSIQQCVLTLIQKGWVQSAHDCSEGGFLVTLAGVLPHASLDTIRRQHYPHAGALTP